jgi:hypothetical protein
MARIVVIVSLLLAGCEVGELPGLGGDGGADGGSGCVAVSTTIPSGHHNPGMGCMSAGQCHNQALGLGPAAPAYSYGGTLYKADKVTPFPGATIIIKLGNAEKKVTAADNGNFWMVPGVAGLELPTVAMRAQTTATACPNMLPMVGTLGAGDGDCNKAGACHAPGSPQGAVWIAQ